MKANCGEWSEAKQKFCGFPKGKNFKGNLEGNKVLICQFYKTLLKSICKKKKTKFVGCWFEPGANMRSQSLHNHFLF